MRLMAYNIEWFDDHFNADNSLKDTQASQKKFGSIAKVLSKADPDLIGITEGPNTTTTTGQRSTVTALENFASEYGLRQNKALIGFPSGGRQEIALLYDPNIVTVEHDPGGKAGTGKPPFNEYFFMDSDGDGIKERYKHYRPPLEVKVTRSDNGKSFWVIVAHAKSKGIFSAMDRVHFDRTSERNRRKLFAECMSIRERVDEWLKKKRSVVVMGDINDGPGFDYYESKFGRSSVELIVGDIFEIDTLLRYPVGRPKFGQYGWEPSSARFKDRFTGDYVNAIIDHIIVSKQFKLLGDDAYKVWNPYPKSDDPFIASEAKAERVHLNGASDHFPITLDIE